MLGRLFPFFSQSVVVFLCRTFCPMKPEYDFSKGKRKFYNPNAVFSFPVYLEPDVIGNKNVYQTRGKTDRIYKIYRMKTEKQSC